MYNINIVTIHFYSGQRRSHFITEQEAAVLDIFRHEEVTGLETYKSYVWNWIMEKEMETKIHKEWHENSVADKQW